MGWVGNWRGSEIARRAVAAIWLTSLVACSPGVQHIDGLEADVYKPLARLAMLGKGVAVLDADGTLWADDVGEAFLMWQLENGVLDPDQEARIAAEWDGYERGEVSELEIWTRAATCQQGLDTRAVQESAEQFFRDNFRRKIFAPMAASIALLQENGIDVWIVSASHKWIVEAGAAEFGVDADYVIAVTAVVEDGIITGVPVEPVPYGPGKVDAIQSIIGATP